ncbi:MAG: ParB/RepB/Spo0J family partition protein [Treponema sp.]|nr:ParB/RepB/Spo0J family partition protein [Treponema sp.]
MAKNRLGRGLGALLSGDEENKSAKTAAEGGPAPRSAGPAKNQDGGAALGPSGEVLISLDRLAANPGQPRKRFGEAELEGLAASIRQQGVIQPIIVEEDKAGNYIIIAGERRSRAARMAGLSYIPAIVRNVSPQRRLEIALVENIHRADLNPIEEAAAYKNLMETRGLSQDETAKLVGKDRTTVANALRLLKLPAAIREALEEGSISAGHARAILSLPGRGEQELLFKNITARGLSVRAAEKQAAELASKQAGGPAGGGKGAAEADGKSARRDPQIKAMEEKFIEVLGTKAVINGDLRKGRIEIEYYSMEDLDRLYGILERAGSISSQGRE